jgi:BASS family bile acid:Na+ symporter
MNKTELVLLFLKVSIVINVFALGLTAKLSDATFFFRRPQQLVRAFLSMNIVMPVFALLMALSFHLDPAVKIALVALSVSPVPPFFPKTALKAGGKENYTVGLLVAVGLLAIIVVPVTMAIVQRIVYIPLQMPVRDVAVLVLRTIIVPLLVGIAIRAFAPVFAGRTAKPIGTLAMVLLVLSVLPVLFGSARAMLSLIGNGTILAFAAFALVGLIVG